MSDRVCEACGASHSDVSRALILHEALSVDLCPTCHTQVNAECERFLVNLLRQRREHGQCSAQPLNKCQRIWNQSRDLSYQISVLKGHEPLVTQVATELAQLREYCHHTWPNEVHALQVDGTCILCGKEHT